MKEAIYIWMTNTVKYKGLSPVTSTFTPINFDESQGIQYCVELLNLV